MTITQLTYFVAAAEQLHLTRVAEQFHVSQPAISTAIRELEKEFHIKLFERHHKEIRLTPDGDRAYRGAKELLEHYKGYQSILSDISNPVRSCTIAMAPNVSLLHLPGLYLHFKETEPDFKLNGFEESIANMTHMLKNGLLDVACLACNPENMDPALHYVPVGALVLKLCVHNSLLYHEGETLPPEKLRNLPLALFRRGTLHNEFVRNYYAKVGLSPNVIYEASQLSTIRKLIQLGIAAGYMPPSLFARDEDVGIYSLGEADTVTIHMVYKGKTPNIELFLRRSREYFRLQEQNSDYRERGRP